MKYHIEVNGLGMYRAWYKEAWFWHKVGEYHFSYAGSYFEHTKFATPEDVLFKLKDIRNTQEKERKASLWSFFKRGELDG